MNDIDPVTLKIIWSRLVNVAEESWLTISRTAFSLIISESYDFGCELLDADGESLAHSPRSMPVFNITLSVVARRMLEVHPPSTLRDGDVLITNDPWLCAGHLFDLAVVTPVFRNGRLVAFSASVAHCTDIGGIRDSLAAREIYDEGFQIPPMKLHRAGVPNEDLLMLLAANVRVSNFVLGDVQAQVTANQVGVQRLLEIMDTYGLDDLVEVGREIQGRSERVMRDAIEALPDGTYRYDVSCDGAGEPLVLPVAVTVAGSTIHVDWDGAPPQVERGGVNCTLSYITADCMYILKCLLTPETPSNAGCFRPFSVDAPAGSVLNCDYPAAVNMRTMVGWYVAPALMGALAQADPERVQAFTAFPMWVLAYGQDPQSGTFSDHFACAGGQGAGANADGMNAILFPTSAANTAVELFEARTPLVVDYKELRTDSGGRGRHRGGLGTRFALRVLEDHDRPVLVGFTPNGALVDPPAGPECGGRGPRVSVSLHDGDEVVADWALNGLAELCSTRQRLVFELGGGSGHGPADARPLDAIEADLANEYISVDGLSAYGCSMEEGRVVRSSVRISTAEGQTQ
jgi:5-oxoprolinase (ATP-hydrolysing)